MSTNTTEESSLFTVVESMNAHDTVTVRSTVTHATYHLVSYADESTRRALSSLSAGESARLDLSRVGNRGNVWRAETAVPRPAAPTRGVPAED